MDSANNLKSHPSVEYLANILDNHLYGREFFSNEVVTITKTDMRSCVCKVVIMCGLPMEGPVGSLTKGNNDEFAWCYTMKIDQRDLLDLVKPGATFDSAAYADSLKYSSYLIRAIEGKDLAGEGINSPARVVIVKGMLDLIQERRKSIERQ